MRLRFPMILAFCFLTVPLAAGLSLSIGSSGVSSPLEIFGGETIGILIGARLPRVLAAGLVGAALASSGAALQGILRNPLAEPFVLGVSGGAALGGTAAIVFGLNMTDGAPWIVVFSFAAAALTTMMLSMLNRVRGRTPVLTILLTGVVFNAFAAAVITFIKFLIPMQRTQQLTFWLSGMLGYESWSTLATVGVAIFASIAVLTYYGNRLNILSLGDSVAATLGVNPSGLRTSAFLLTSLLTAAAVSISGLVGFVGLIVPQALRLAVTPDQRFLVPASAAAGASFLMLCDAACRVLIGILGSEPPIGSVTAIIGGPVFLILLRKHLKGSDIT